MSRLSRSIDIYVVYKIIRKLTTNFTDMDAFKLGIIDENGNFLKKMRDLKTNEERSAMTYLDRLIINIKKILVKVPMLGSRLGTVAVATYFLMKEDNTLNDYDIESSAIEILESIDIDELMSEGISFAEHKLVAEALMLSEDAPANSVGAGNVAFTPDAVSKKKKVQFSEFAGCRVYDVDTETYHRCAAGKQRKERFSRYVKDIDLLQDVRQYARSKPSSSIMLRDSGNGTKVFLKIGKKHPFPRGL